MSAVRVRRRNLLFVSSAADMGADEEGDGAASADGGDKSAAKYVGPWDEPDLRSLEDDQHEGRLLAAQFRDYADGTSIHGVKYTCEPGRASVERLLWVLLCAGSVVLTVAFMAPQYQKWRYSPTITSIETTNHPIWNIDFPAVTVCSNNKVMDQQLRREVKKYPWNETHIYGADNDTDRVQSALKGVLQRYVFFAEDDSTFKSEVTPDEQFVILNHSKSIPSTLRNVMHKCKDMMLVCLWQGSYTPCTELFAVMRTDSGFCCSFNAINQKDQFGDDDDNTFEAFDEINEYDYINTYLDDVDADWIDEEYFDEYFDEYGYEFDETTEAGGGGGGGDGDTTAAASPGESTTTTAEEPAGSSTSAGVSTSTGSTGSTGESTSVSTSSTESTTSDGSSTSAGSTGSSTSAASSTGSTDSTTTEEETTTTGSTSTVSASSTTTTGEETTSGSTTETARRRRRRRRRREVPKGNKLKKKRQIRVRRKRSTSGSSNSSSSSSSSSEPRKIKRSNSASTILGLSVLLYPNSKAYNVSLNNYYGFKILVHSPYSFPEPSSKGFAIGQGTESFIGVSAQLTESTDAVKSMDLSRRKCLNRDEDLTDTGVHMQAFLKYSRASCLLECRAELLFEECGCLPYYYPDFSLIWNKDTTCDLEGLKCIGGKTRELHALNPETTDDEGLVHGASCNCPNDCNEVIYSQELSSAELRKDSLIFKRLETDSYGPLAKVVKDMEEAKAGAENATACPRCAARHKVLQSKLNEIKANSTFVHIYFKELGIIKYTRDQLYTTMDAIAAFGGIVGLCMGFSLLSGMELVYFFTLRLFIDQSRKKQELKNKNSLN